MQVSPVNRNQPFHELDFFAPSPSSHSALDLFGGPLHAHERQHDIGTDFLSGLADVRTPGLHSGLHSGLGMNAGMNTGMNTPGMNTPGMNTPGMNTDMRTPGMNNIHTPGLNDAGLHGLHHSALYNGSNLKATLPPIDTQAANSLETANSVKTADAPLSSLALNLNNTFETLNAPAYPSNGLGRENTLNAPGPFSTGPFASFSNNLVGSPSSMTHGLSGYASMPQAPGRNPSSPSSYGSDVMTAPTPSLSNGSPPNGTEMKNSGSPPSASLPGLSLFSLLGSDSAALTTPVNAEPNMFQAEKAQPMSERAVRPDLMSLLPPFSEPATAISSPSASTHQRLFPDHRADLMLQQLLSQHAADAASSPQGHKTAAPHTHGHSASASTSFSFDAMPSQSSDMASIAAATAAAVRENAGVPQPRKSLINNIRTKYGRAALHPSASVPSTPSMAHARAKLDTDLMRHVPAYPRTAASSPTASTSAAAAKDRLLLDKTTADGRKLTEIPAVEDDPSIKPYGCCYPACRSGVSPLSKGETSFRTIRELRAHVAQHKRLGEKPGHTPFRCALDPCGRTFKSLAGLRWHFQNASANGHFYVSLDEGADQPTKKFKTFIESSDRHEQCPVHGCTKAFKQPAGLAYHLAHAPEHVVDDRLLALLPSSLVSKVKWWLKRKDRDSGSPEGSSAGSSAAFPDDDDMLDEVTMNLTTINDA